MKRFVCGFYRCSELILLMRERAGKFNGVGGEIGDEPIKRALSRKFHEHAGPKLNPELWSHKLTLVGDDWTIYFCVAEGPDFTPFENNIEWCNLFMLPLDIVQNLNWIIPLCFDTTLRFPIEINDDRQTIRCDSKAGNTA